MPRFYAGLVKIDLYLPLKTYNKIEEMRQELGMARSAFIRYLIETCLQAIDRRDTNGSGEESVSTGGQEKGSEGA